MSAVANRFVLRCEPKRLMLLYYKICSCCVKGKRPQLTGFCKAGFNIALFPLTGAEFDKGVPESFDSLSKELFDDALDFKGMPSCEFDKHSSN